jgi:GNAT superfamily N-acetyltransferase
MKTASGTAAYAIQEVELAAASDALLSEVAELRNVLNRELLPDDPPSPPEAFIARVRARPKMVRMKEWLAREGDGSLAATAFVARYEADTNQHFREAGVSVLPRHRRRGIGRALYQRIVQGTGEGEDIVIDGYTTDRVPAGEAFARSAGAKEVLRTHVNQLDLRELDRQLVREWTALAPAGYGLRWIDGDVPDELIANVLLAYDTMNTAPRGSSRADDWHTTREQVGQWDRSRTRAGRERRLVLAIHEATGETAGFTELEYGPKIPHVIGQQGTAVIPAHRGRGIGKWIKGAMLDRALRDWPAARYVRTGNADSNAPMLAINTRLGFTPIWATTIWEVGIAEARRYAKG